MYEARHEIDIPNDVMIKHPFLCHTQKTRRGSVAVDAHWHYYIEMIYSLSGKCKVFLNGLQHDFNKGDLLLINSREVHSIYVKDDEDVEYIVLRFDPEVLYTTSRSVFESKYVSPFIMSKAQHQKVFSEEQIKNTIIPYSMFEIVRENKEKKYGFELAVKTHICGIFLWILRSWDSQGLSMDAGKVIKDNDLKMLQKVFDYLDANYQNDITVESMAKMCNLSYSYFSRQFKELMGKTFTDYLNYIRITEAEKLLLSTDMNITQIALEIGFSSSSYFIQQFRHFKNVSPKQFKFSITKSKSR